MVTQTNIALFKDRITKSGYPALIAELNQAIDAGEDALKRLLFGLDNPDVYTSHGRYQLGNHSHCGGLTVGKFREDRLCKCLYFYNGKYRRPTECASCDFQARYDLIGRYQIADYEVPAHYYADGVGEIDLVLKAGETLYAAEVKPYRGNHETLLRMVAEIMTYTLGETRYQKAIAFFENTPQAKEYEQIFSPLQALLEKADITVFCFEKRGAHTTKYANCDPSRHTPDRRLRHGPGGNYHCFNVADGCVFDLTSEQFGYEVLDYDDCSEQFREAHFAKEEKRLRYKYLRTQLLNKRVRFKLRPFER